MLAQRVHKVNDQITTDPDIRAIDQSADLTTPLSERIGRQRILLRWIVTITALLLLLALVFLESIVLCYLLRLDGGDVQIPVVLLAISPIIAGTTIVAFLLLGAFRGFREPSDQNLLSIAQRLLNVLGASQ